MNALVGKVQILPVTEFTVWYESVVFEGVQTDAALIDGDGEFLLLNPGWGWKLIHVSQVKRVITHHVAIGEEINVQEIQEYDQYWADR